MSETNLEKSYYENDSFWEEDAFNVNDFIRIDETIKFIPKDVSTLADVGCGNGIFLNKLLKLSPELNTIGLERSEAALKHVKVPSINCSIDALPVEDGKYDCVTCLEVIEHLPYGVYEKGLSELCRISNKYVIISVPFKEDLSLNYTACPSCSSLFNQDMHLRSFDETTMKNLLAKYGFEAVDLVNLVKYKHPIGVDAIRDFRKKISRIKASKFDSPVCPVCGFVNEGYNKVNVGNKNAVSNKRAFKSFIKKFLPKKLKDGYWILALYQRKN